MSTLEHNITGQAYWRSLEEYANTPEFQDRLQDEFADYAPDEIQSMSRRTFLKLAGASMALAGLTMTGCRRWPKEELAPFASRPEDMIPGVPNYFASMTQRAGVAHPVLVASFDGRPIKVESHPNAGYSTDVFDQALTLQQYDPDRARDVTFGKADAATRGSWTAFESFIKGKVAELKAAGDGSGFAVLSEASSSPTFLRLKAELQSQMPNMTWATWEPLNQDNAIAGAKLALGRAVRQQYDVSAAHVIACFDCDFLCDHPSATKNAKGWAAGRKSADAAHAHGHGDDHAQAWMNRLYAAEPGMTITGSAADERLPIKPSRVAYVLTAVAVGVGVNNAGNAPTLTEHEQVFVTKLVEDLSAHKGTGIVVAGASQPAEVHALTHAINAHLENVGSTITYTDEPIAEKLTNLESLYDLAGKTGAGDIDTLVILGGNPKFDGPGGLDFGGDDTLGRVPNLVYLGLYRENETATLCDWVLPAATGFESWGDGRWYDGTLAIQQPLILPLFNGRSAEELLASLVGEAALTQPSSYKLVRKTFKDAGLLSGADFASVLDDPGYAADQRGFEKDWRRAVHLGYVPGSAFTPTIITTTIDTGPIMPTLQDSADLEIVFHRGSVYDGRFANSAWLQEVPDPHTKVTWDNPVSVSVPDAESKGLKYGDIVEVQSSGSVEMPVYIQPGQAEGVLVVQLGNGREVCGHVGKGVGFNTYPFRHKNSIERGYGPATLGDTVGHHRLAMTSVHHLVNSMGGFPTFVDDTAEWALKKRAGELGASGTAGNIIKEGTFAQYQTTTGLGHIMGHPHGDYRLQLYNVPLQEQWTQQAEALAEEHKHEVEDHGWQPRTAFNAPHAWGMTIDLNSCIGCNACVIACQAENNIPTVGKDQVWRSREMHWLRNDTYYKGDPEDPNNVQVVHQPITCVHCENAPCEQVCPVAATVHDAEGLNTMVYNRCIGTRYCSNNCPYKVRRFNYFDFHSKSVRQDVANPWLNMPDTQQDSAVDKIKSMVFNPDVTVRMRGVMEKCTYCTQRIQRAKIARKNAFVQNKEGAYGHEDATTKTVPDGTIVTACQDACPTGCITFGDLNDPHSKVSQIQTHNKRAYSVLAELNSRPRTQHLAKLRNPHPSSVAALGHGGDGDEEHHEDDGH
ncbi:TAT-variant-translocated molybdopterin oxidoreductase [Phycisphaeraceae bacterium D3-23]